MLKIKAYNIESAVVNFYDPRANLIVPNVFWGMFDHECDLLVLTKSGYAIEIEIKISAWDLKRDLKKKGHHASKKLKKLYFAIPEKLSEYSEYIPEHAGIITVDNKFKCTISRKAKITGNYKFSDAERYQIARLGALRIWGLKKKNHVLSFKKL